MANKIQNEHETNKVCHKLIHLKSLSKTEGRTEKSTGSQSPWTSPKLTVWWQKKLETLRRSWFTLRHSASKIKFMQRNLKQTAPDCGPSFSQFGAWDDCLAIAGQQECQWLGFPMAKQVPVFSQQEQKTATLGMRGCGLNCAFEVEAGSTTSEDLLLKVGKLVFLFLWAWRCMGASFGALTY